MFEWIYWLSACLCGKSCVGGDALCLLLNNQFVADKTTNMGKLVPYCHNPCCLPQDQDTDWEMSQGQWCCRPRVLWEMLMVTWMGKRGQAQEWTVPFFKCHACKANT